MFIFQRFIQLIFYFQLNQKYNEYLEEIRQRISVVKDELLKWWDQCHVPQPERERFETVDPGMFCCCFILGAAEHFLLSKAAV